MRRLACAGAFLGAALVASTGACGIFDGTDDCNCPSGDLVGVDAGSYVFETSADFGSGLVDIDDEFVVFTYTTADGSRWRVEYEVIDIREQY